MNMRVIPGVAIGCFSVCGVALLNMEGRAAEAPQARPACCAQVAGSVFIKGAGGMANAISNQAWDLARTIIYLVPKDPALRLPAPSSRRVVSQKNAQFAPSMLVVVKGQTVEFPNDDSIDHNVFSMSKVRKFDLGIYPKGQGKSVTFDKVGPVLILCSIHEKMSGVIYVVPNPLYTQVNAQGRYSIAGVPSGRYVLRTWHPSLPEHVKHIEVRGVDVEAGRVIQENINLAEVKPPEAL